MRFATGQLSFYPILKPLSPGTTTIMIYTSQNLKPIIQLLAFSGLLMLIGTACNRQNKENTLRQPAADQTINTKNISFSEALLQDKILGMLIGSAIGDAMGAPTEMWSRTAMQTEYGYISDLTPVIREPSAEGTWAYNLPPGGTTDDTRWKVLVTNFVTGTDKIVPPLEKDLQPKDFASFIMRQYQQDIDELKDIDSFEPGPFEQGMRQISWLQEWAVVSKAFVDNDITAYTQALNRFYGGEMVCAGMLFAPALGGFYPGNPARAYDQCYQIDIYDIGYARDISGLTAAMVAAAIPPDATPDSILAVVRDIDPQGYFKSRLVGRIAYNLLKDARAIVRQAQQTQIQDVFTPGTKTPVIPTNSPHDSLYHAQLEAAYALLHSREQYMPFHASEIYLVNLVALLFSDFDFQQALEFVINFGRDNDTTGAVTGAILGAYYGAEKLPKAMVEKVIRTNQKMGVDFTALAQSITQTIISGQDE